MNKVFTDNGWEDYVYWEPELLRNNLSGFWSRRINDKDRLIYKIEQDNIYILSCRYHYSDK